MFSDFPTQESFFSLGTNICLYRMDLLLDSGHKELLLTEGLPTLWWIKAGSCVLYTISWQITSSADKDSCAGIKRKPIHTKQKILEIGYKSKTCIWKNTDKFKETARVSEKYIGMSLEEQGIYTDLRQMSIGELPYSMDSTHYSDVYGLFVSKSASCAGETRAIGLCLNQLGIPYTHVNEGVYSHQWCRVDVNGTYWICDAYGMYVGPEPTPNQHPYFWE